jgi:hypothetical protein
MRIKKIIPRCPAMHLQFQYAMIGSLRLPATCNGYRRGSFVTPAEALAFVRTHGLVLESGTGPVPSLAAAVAGGPIRGSWWAHARGREIFAVTRAIRDCPDVLVCRLVDGKITYVHRHLLPALVRLSKRFPQTRLAQIREVHTVSGKHVAEEVRFPAWVSREIAAQASDLDEETALRQLGTWCTKGKPIRKGARRKTRSP